MQSYLEAGVTVSLGYSKHRLGPGNTVPTSGKARLEVILGANLRARSSPEYKARWGMYLLFGSHILRVKANI